VKLIFDENLAPKLAVLLAGEFPECTHVMFFDYDPISST